MVRLKSIFRPLLVGAAGLLLGGVASAQVVETVKDYTITIEEKSTDCDFARDVGELCGAELNVIYLGEGLSGRKLFTTDTTLPATKWNDGNATTSYMSLTNVSSGARGSANTTSLIATDANSAITGVQPHLAAASCANLSHGGFDDWYLPSALEAHLFFLNRASIPVSAGTFWTSSEFTQTTAYAFNTGTGALTATSKSTTNSVQCVRSGTVPVEPAKPCDTVSAIGETCGGGAVVYAGPALSGEGLFTTAFPLPAVTWNNGMSTTSYMAMTNVQSGVNGAANTTALAVRDADTAYSGTQVHAAAEYCENMTYGGYSDWYLPASAEAHTLFLNKAALPVKTGAIWTSSEYDQTTARAFDIGTGASSAVSKSTARSLICVRRGPVPAQVDAPCDGLTGVGQTCGAGDVVLAGESVNGGYLFTTAFQLPAHAWNDGMTSTPYMTLTNLTSGMTGSANTAALAAADANTAYSLTQPHAAAEVCASLVYGGYSDWYLPASIEAAELYRNRGSLPVSSGVIWTSTETGQTTANAIDIATGALASTTKSTTRAVQCVRKSAAPLVAATDCDDITAVGGVCGNGNIILAGESLSGGRLYTTTVQMPAVTWNAGMSSTTYMTMTNVMSGTDGAANTAALLSRDSDSANSGTQAHVAAESCANMSYGGYSDWHLPAAHEAYELHRNRALLPTAIASGAVWTSTEVGQTTAQVFDIGAGSLTPTAKSTSRAVQCVRREAISFSAAQSCDTATAIGDTCGGGTVVYAGPALSGEGLFATAFPLPAVTWNNGMTTTSYMVMTNVQSGVNGAANSTDLAVRDADTAYSGTQIHAAAEACQNMTYGGYSDWYLPASAEAHTLFLNKAALPVKTGAIWTSSEVGQTTARGYDLSTGSASSVTKSSARGLLCVRRGGSAAPTVTDCSGVGAIGDLCGNGETVLAGEADGNRIYTTSFSLPATFWNDGLTTTNYMRSTNVRSETDGEANTTALAITDSNTLYSGAQTHSAAETCSSLSYLGYEDWYLPSIGEAEILFANRAVLPPFGQIWSSTEATQTTAISLTSTGTRSNVSKASALSVQCVRSEPIPVDPTVVLSDGFETFSGWNMIGSGAVSFASDQARSGTGSVLKSLSDDPNGGYKLLSSPVGRNYEMEVWIRSSDPRAGGGADRITIADADGNGYGFNIGSGSHSLDVRTGYVSTVVSGATWSRPSNAWYRVVFRAMPDNTFRTVIYDAAGMELSTHTYPADTTHTGPFDRVAILGGRNYHVDDLTVTNLDAVTPYWDSALNRFKSAGRDPRDIYGWAAPAGLQNVTISRDASVTDSPLGGTPLKMVVTGADPHIGTYNTWGGDWRIAPAANGETWEVRVLAKASAPTTIQTFIFGGDAAGVWSYEVGNIGAANHNVSTEWQEFTYRYTFTSPNVQTFQTRLDGPQDGTPVDIWFDGLQVYKVE